MADDNEIMTADTQAENTADTADTGQTTPTTEELNVGRHGHRAETYCR